MCVPALPAGCGPSKTSSLTPATAGTVTFEPGAAQTNVVPDVNLARQVMPAWKSSIRPASTTSTAGACGRVSIAVMNSARGEEAGSGTRENGRVRKDVHRPDSSSSARTASAESCCGAAPV
jgi:hypothetical protein